MPPSRDAESAAIARGRRLVAGIDEVGKGAWAGPLAVGIALIPEHDPADASVPIRDSKTISERTRERIFDDVAAWCTAWSVGMASPIECDELGMAEAQRLALRRALDALAVVPDAALVDGSWDFVSPEITDVTMIVKGDSTSLSIAAASILAKVTRDRLMRELAVEFPAWRFDTNKGYPCHWHRTALAAYGPSSVHRTSWAFMDNFVPWPGAPRRSRTPQLFAT